MSPKKREGGMKVITKFTTYQDYAERLVKMLTSKRGVLVDWESEMGKRIYYEDPEYPEYEFCIRTWDVRPIPDGLVVDSYTIYPEKKVIPTTPASQVPT